LKRSKAVNSYNRAHGRIQAPLFNALPSLNHEIIPARAELSNRTMPEQSQKAPVQPEKPLKTPEQESGVIVEQMQKPLCEQNRRLRNHLQRHAQRICRRLNSYNSDAAFDYRKTIVSTVCTIVAGIVSLKNLVYVASPYI
jgi:uncharacterized FlaG/YvyC family protein